MQWSAGVDQSTDGNLTTGDYGSNQMDHQRGPPHHQHAPPQFSNGPYPNGANAYGNLPAMPPVQPSQAAPFGQDASYNSFRMGDFQQGYPPGQHMPGVRPGGGFQQYGQAMPVQPFGPPPGQMAVMPAQPFSIPGDGTMQPMMIPYPGVSSGMPGPWGPLHGAHAPQAVEVHTDPAMFAGAGMTNMMQYQYYTSFVPSVSAQGVYVPVNREVPTSTSVGSKAEDYPIEQPRNAKDAGDEMVERLMGKMDIGSGTTAHLLRAELAKSAVSGKFARVSRKTFNTSLTHVSRLQNLRRLHRTRKICHLPRTALKEQILP